MTVVVMVVMIVRPTVIGVRGRRVVDPRPIVIVRAIIIAVSIVWMRRCDRARGQRAGGKTEREARPDTACFSRSRRGHGGGADSTNGRQNSQCLADHDVDPPLKFR